MSTIIKLLIAITLLNAIGRGGMAAWTFYEFRDETQQLLLFDDGTPTDRLRDQILEMARARGVPVQPEGVLVTREGQRTAATAAYTQPVEFFPRYVVPVELSFMVDAFGAGSLRPGDNR